MDTKIAEEFLDELFSSLEALETQGAAVLQFLKEQAEVTDEELGPYMEEAGKASNVRWRAARLRMMSLFSSAVKSAEQPSEKKTAAPAEKDERSASQRKQPEAEPSQQVSMPAETTETQKSAKGENEPAPDQGPGTTSKQEKAGPERPSTDDAASQDADEKDAA